MAVVTSAISAGVAIAGGIYKAVDSGIKKKKAKNAKENSEKLLKELEKNRSAIPNPYEDVEDLSGMIKNEFANLSVSTQAAEFQAEEADIALASTLDTMRQSGMGAGGATALAQAALRSKKGISASIEQQETSNEKLRADGATAANTARMNEAKRMQKVGVQAEMFEYGEKEKRFGEKADRYQSQIDQAAAQEMAYSDQMAGAIMGTASSAVTGAAGISDAMGIKADALSAGIDLKDLR